MWKTVIVPSLCHLMGVSTHLFNSTATCYTDSLWSPYFGILICLFLFRLNFNSFPDIIRYQTTTICVKIFFLNEFIIVSCNCLDFLYIIVIIFMYFVRISIVCIIFLQKFRFRQIKEKGNEWLLLEWKIYKWMNKNFEFKSFLIIFIIFFCLVFWFLWLLYVDVISFYHVWL